MRGVGGRRAAALERRRPGSVRRSAQGICVAALALCACSGAISEYSARVLPSPKLERPLITARRCLELFGYDLKLMDLEGGIVWVEKIEIAGDGPPGVVVSEVAVMQGGGGVRIIARSRRASSVHEGWRPARVSDSVRRDVDRLRRRMGGSRRGSMDSCIWKLSRRDGKDGESTPFATLFVPPLRSTPERPHPLVRAFLEVAADPSGREERAEADATVS